MAHEVDIAQQQREPHIEVYEDGSGRWRWRLIAGNGEPMCQGEDHRDPTDAIRAVTRIEDVFAARPNVIISRKRAD